MAQFTCRFLLVLLGLMFSLVTCNKVKPALKRISITREDGLDLLKDNNRRQLREDRSLQISLELELEHAHQTVLTCPEMKYRPDLCPIDADVAIHIDGVLTRGGHACETYMSDDFKCVLTITNEGAVEGLLLKDHHAVDFIVPTGCPECADIELDPVIPDCGTDKHDASGRRLRGDKVGEERKLANYYEWLDRWDGCYPNMDTTTDVYMGIAVGSHLVTRVGGVQNVGSFIEMIVAETNAIYLAQLNVKLHVNTIIISETAGAYDWDNPSCSDTIYQQYDKFKLWNKPSEEGLWHIIDDCYVSTNPIGLATVGTLCGNGNNVGITHHGRHLGKTWLTFAHEVGHNFGAGHSFQDGQGTTGGIMDYGDGLLNNEYQFNSQYQFSNICNKLTSSVEGSTCNNKINTNTAATAECGNGVVDSSEQCECPGGAQECDCCLNCQLKSHAQCSPFNNECCTDQCQYAGTAQTCENSDGTGYCRGGVCASADCASLGLGPFCGVRSDNPCRKMCNYGPYCIELSSNDAIRDGALCRTGSIPEGVCTAGVCQPTDSSPPPDPTNFPTPSPVEPTNFPTPSPTDFPTPSPTDFPTPSPTEFPTPNPVEPTNFPTPSPTDFPTPSPTDFPTPSPTDFPTPNPTNFPTPGANYCGDGVCAGEENCNNCPQDCQRSQRGKYWCCGDGVYDKKEQGMCDGHY